MTDHWVKSNRAQAFGDAALAYAHRGWPVCALRPCSKVPLLAKAQGGRGVYDATLDLDRIREWWRREPEANVAVSCACFWLFDVDNKDVLPVSLNGADSYGALTARYGPLPRTVTSLTGCNGWHLLFAPDARVRTTNGILPGIDIKSAPDGYIVAPPSVHPDTGRRYRWRPGYGPDEIEIATAPDWLLALVEPVELPEPPPNKIAAGDLGRYAQAALASACENIERASVGCQEMRLNGEAWSIGCLVAGGVIPRDTARAALVAAGSRMPSQQGRRPWTRSEIAWKVERAFATAAASPREVRS